MNATEVQDCLTYLLDRSPQTRLNDGTAKAWAEDFARWDYATGREAIRRATGDKPFVGIAEITAQVRIIRQEQINQRRVAEKFAEAHCTRTGCRCNHDACYKGWTDSREFEGAVTPCPHCKSDLRAVLRTLPDPGSRGQNGHVPIYERNKTKEKA
jgi:hypothetical protein